MALPSTSTGSKAWMPRRWRVGARFSSTGCSWMTSLSTSHTWGRCRSTMRLAALMFCATSWSTSRFMTKGLNNSSAMALGRPHWCRLQLRADHDHRAARVVDALAEQVLAEASLLALEHVGQRLQRTAARAGDGAAAPPVVEQGVHRLLQHPLLVVDDDLGGAEVEQPLQAVVAVDDAAVEVVEVAGGEAAAVELHHGAQVGRDHRDGLEDHGPRVVGALGEGGQHLEALGGPLPPLRRVGLEVFLELGDLGVEVEPAEQVLDRLGAHAAGEVLLVAVAHLAPQLLGLDELLDLQAAEGVEGLDDELLLVVGPLLAIARPRAPPRAGPPTAPGPWPRPAPSAPVRTRGARGGRSATRRTRAAPGPPRSAWPARARASALWRFSSSTYVMR